MKQNLKPLGHYLELLNVIYVTGNVCNLGIVYNSEAI